MKIHYVHTRPVDSQEANIIQVFQMCKAFGQLGHDVTLSVPAHASKSSAVELVQERMGVHDIGFHIRTYKRFSLRNRFKSIGCIPGALKEVREVASDLLFVRVFVLLLFLSKRHKNIFFEIHNSRIGPAALSNNLVAPLLVKIAKRPTMKAFVTISEALGRWWAEKGVPLPKLLNLHDGVDLERFGQLPDKREARKKLSLPEEGKIVVYTGSLYKDRGMDRVLKLAEDISDVQFVVVGGPQERRVELEKLAEQRSLRNLRFVGHRPQKEIPLYLASADVLLMLWSKDVPTMNYCSPLKLFEYLASGRVIVGDGFPTILEVMKNNEHGYLVDPESYTDLKAALQRALSSPEGLTMAKNAQNLAKHYSWGMRCQSILQFTNRG